ncbi:membrane metalloprotease [Flavobacterium sp. AC]|uniref:Membrane metalloprotease n=1 Tax=Flavobacterium azizsancarii TaxID=2961580 RepID=A0ABT4WE47_9FLAO|nr:membrane metalloprotease [Flavobacterium azizsancarii]MDA6070389.1 membrane metalloprotease [Flavobacterium azizsancarii]
MKNIISLLTLGLFLFITSCSKEEDAIDHPTAINIKANKQPTGNSANDLLSDKKFKSIVIELVYVEGFEPGSAAINNFVSFLTARAHKPNGIRVIKRSIASPGNSGYSNEKIASIEDANRTQYNSQDEIAVWAFFADGKSSSDTGTSVILGTAYRNTSFVIFEQTIQGLSNSPSQTNRSKLETTVITHEFGHVLGLTNLGTPLQSNHEDAEHQKHCSEKTCLMYWSSETGSGISNMLTGGAPPQLDAQCIADLRANGGK